MTKPSVAQLPAKLYDLLSPLTAEERARVVQATLILFGDETSDPPDPRSGGGTGSPKPKGAEAFFDDKAPANKGEVLAVAARYREEVEGEERHKKADLKQVITAARRNFDDRNFARDINNARRQAGFFNIGTGRDASRLSYYGKQYVDALPDREKASKLPRPRVGGSKKTSRKKLSKRGPVKA